MKKRISNRIWVIMLGVAVALVIAVTLLFNGKLTSAFSINPPKKVPAAQASVILDKMLRKIDLTIYR